MARNRPDALATDVESVIDEATRRLIHAAQPEKVILFGSHARGDFDARSDLDLLVILAKVEHRFEEMVRLYEALRGLPLAADIVVYSVDQVRERGDLPGTMLYHALREGRTLYEAA